MKHLCWHKPWFVMLGREIEALPDIHPSKPECLFHLSRLFQTVGNCAEPEWFLTHASKLSRERGDDHKFVQTLRQLSNIHLRMRLFKDGIQQAKGASEIYERPDCRKHEFEEAKSESLRALHAFETLGAANDMGGIREPLRQIDYEEIN